MCASMDIFRRPVTALMRPARLVVPPEAPCAHVTRRMAELGTSCAVVVAADGRVRGVLDERDITRRAAYRLPGDAPVHDALGPGPAPVPGDCPVFRALGLLQRSERRHLAVIGPDGALAGILHIDDGLRSAASRAVQRLAGLATAGDGEGLRQARAQQAPLAADLLDDDTDPLAIQEVLSRLNDDIHRRALDLARETLAADGWGEPPCAFALIQMGSGGRLESLLDPDQDHGLVIADYPDTAHGAVDRYFSELAARLTRHLDGAGIPHCPGHIMATNPLWRKTASQWQAQIRGWLHGRTEQGFLQTSILLDCRGMAGDVSLAEALRADLIARCRRAPGYLRSLTLSDSPRDVGLGWFHRLLTETGDGAHAGELHLKRHGIMPVVEVARLYALAHGIEASSTPGRLEALQACGALPGERVEALRDAHRFMVGLLLRTQLRSMERGQPPGKHVAPETLAPGERERLVRHLRTVQSMVRRVSRDLAGADAAL